ncbi:hypothetical protein BST81_13640 [Leptolyngbya sp. 'hensonii']|uniref:DUF309 domain-containing protein n=1 Tax=Leptolyngbya sp. 'hensonii' TaxID=1922337 RepID=UPI00094F78B5|nr:DUF309 domain-containing protein [Leptolyngbya sp. 'hensonii']OLP18065.1 hypothetical protein BST81_13640 [Leptolyngbya sp. 'hensonii']
MSVESALPPEFWQGIDLFNQGDYYPCHDILEALWMEAGNPDKTFYQGILQIAVALYHLGNGNQRGAMILLGEGINRLKRYQPTYGGIDVAQLVMDAGEILGQLQQAKALICDFERPFIRQILAGPETSCADRPSS